ncbi:MAG: hypothetical protein KA974_08900 [Saprospiraceae bacterium]|nr:hypothetical protein [Saprospiraceae bacterium]
MKKNDLIPIFQSFSKKEVKDFKKWLLSPAHNSREDVVLLYEYLILDENLYGSATLEKESVFGSIFTNETYNDAKMRQVIYFLKAAVDDFLTYQALLKDAVRAKIMLSSVFRTRKIEKSFLQTIKEAQTLQEKFPYRNDTFLSNEYRLQQEQYLFFEGQKRLVQMNLQEVTDAIDNNYLANKLRQSCLMLAHQTVYKINYDLGLIQEIVRFVEMNEKLSHSAIAIYYYGYKTFFEKENEEHYFNLKKEIDTNEHKFPSSEVRDIYLMAINYCIGRVNAGNPSFTQETFEWYKRGFSKNILIENETVSRFTFRNVVSAATKLKEFGWVEQFIQEYKNLVEDKYRESTVHYSLSKVYYEKGDYKTAMRMISQFENDDILLNLAAKTMLIKMFYEESEFDALESLLESMRTYLQRKDVIGYHKSNYKNIIKYTKKLINSFAYSKQKKLDLKDEITNANPLTEKSWLLEQLVI